MPAMKDKQVQQEIEWLLSFIMNNAGMFSSTFWADEAAAVLMLRDVYIMPEAQLTTELAAS